MSVAYPGVSRKHLKINLQGQTITVQDLGSSNGTFVNGVMVRNAILAIGDKISINEIIFEIAQQSMSLSTAVGSELVSQGQSWQAPQIPNRTTGSVPANSGESPSQKNIFSSFSNYIESVALPGFYKLAEWAEFKMLLGVFILVFIFLVTSLAIIPMAQISRERIEAESQARAMDLASSLAGKYRSAINVGLGSTFTVAEERTEGVQMALIIDANDGHILAPARKVGQLADLPFVNSARKVPKEHVVQINDSTVGASVPIRVLNPETGETSIRAFAVIIYDMGSRALRSNDVIRLFVQVFAFALILGFILYYILYKVIEYPVFELNRQLDQALKEPSDEIKINYNYPIIQKLITNVNSALSRIDMSSPEQSMPKLDSRQEARNLVEAISNPCMIIDSGQTITAINRACEDLIGANGGILLYKSFTEVGDEALKLNLLEIYNSCVSTPSQIATANIEFVGSPYAISGQSVWEKSELKYIVVTFTSKEGVY
jgi:hypothetical protein